MAKLFNPGVSAEFLVPSGFIGMWSGTIANIPDDWVLCDGNNGTPNLIDRFIQCVSTVATNPGATGGADSKTTTGHIHTIPNTDSSTHSHTMPNTDSESLSRTPIDAGGGGASWNLVYQQSHAHSIGSTNTDAHVHAIFGANGNTDTIADIRPKFFELAFIMKT